MAVDTGDHFGPVYPRRRAHREFPWRPAATTDEVLDDETLTRIAELEGRDPTAGSSNDAPGTAR